MRYFLLTLYLLLPFLSFTQEDTEYKEYSYSEFFQMIEDEEDTIFKLKNAIIRFDERQDQRFYTPSESFDIAPTTTKKTINKALELENMLFDSSLPRALRPGWVSINNYTFKKHVRLINIKNIEIRFCTFNDEFWVINSDDFAKVFEDLDDQDRYNYIGLSDNQFNSGIAVNSYSNTKELNYAFYRNTFHFNLDNSFRLLFNGNGNVYLQKNTFIGANHSIELFNSNETLVEENSFESAVTFFDLRTDLSPNLIIKNNKIKGTTLISTKSISPDQAVIDWNQFENGIYDKTSYDLWSNNYMTILDENGLKDSLTYYTEYKAYNLLDKFKSRLAEQTDAYKTEISSLGKFYRFYKDKHDTEFANEVYIQLKNLETSRLGYLYAESPSFKTFFKWRINQFLKVFSAYGTEPERAIVFSIYVILAFALIYLLFPNHWDSHAKNRIVDRYSFFLKYMKRDAGMQVVYLEEKKSDILAYQDYKELIESSGKEVPKFFQATALPMYKWAISGTKLTASLLSKVDVMKGTWSELPQSKRVWKSILLISAFLISLTYDIFIKMLNALMLSINTFTTLGFGEIPIKGLPRYLAIIQGFIGWFMLTIFSVSLISQLLN